MPDGFENGKALRRTVVEEASVVLAPGECFGHPDGFRTGFELPTEELEEGFARIERILE